MAEIKTRKQKLLRGIVVTLVIILIFAIINLAAAKIIYDSLFPRFVYSDYDLAVNIDYEEIKEDYPRKEFGFFNNLDLRLQGYLYGEGNKGIIVVAPGLSSGADDYLSLTTGLADMGWRVLTFDTTGSFMSEGDDSVGFCQETEDLLAALTYIESDRELSRLPVFLVGHSRGGYAAACALESDFDISGVATISGANSPMEVTIDTSKNYVGNFAYAGYPFLYAYQSLIFGTEMTGMSASEAISQSDCPTLIIQGTEDTVTPPDTCSIYAHRDEIENPNAEYLVYSEEYQSGHSNLMYSKDAVLYAQDIDRQYEILTEEYPDGIPEAVADEFYASIDSEKANQPNLQLIEKINTFFEDALK
ncbi:MAG: alpha/beta hydrolase [Ruminococcus sp.]|nr:alpha/beta hydrolase [Ruminococcus sp.]